MTTNWKGDSTRWEDAIDTNVINFNTIPCSGFTPGQYMNYDLTVYDSVSSAISQVEIGRKCRALIYNNNVSLC